MDKLNLNIIIYPFVALASIYGIALNKEKIVYKYLAFILTFLSMIRFDTGYDYYWYYAVSKYQYMYHPRIQRLYVDLEPGIQKIVDLARYYKHPQYFFAITALITFGFIYYTIYKESKSPLTSLTFFMFLEMGFSMGNSYVMQMTALSICFFSTRYVYRKEYIKYIFLIIFASIFFHESAFICLVFLFFPRGKIKNYLWLFYLLALLLVIEIILPKIAQTFYPQYYYLLRNSNKFNIKGSKDIILSVILSIILILLSLKVKNPILKIKKEYKYDVYIKNIFIAGSILSFVLLKTYGGHLPFRIGIYFIVYFFLIAGNYSECIKTQYKIPVKILFIIIFNLWTMRGIIKSNYIFLDKKIGYSADGRKNARPNSYGFKIFINRSENDMDRYLPGEVRFRRN